MILGVSLGLPAAAILVLELSGKTISNKKIVSNHFKWDRTSLIIFLVTLVVYVLASPLRFEFLTILRKGPLMVPAIAPIISILFSLPG